MQDARRGSAGSALRPLRFGGAVALFGASSAVFLVAIYGAGPWLRESGASWFVVFNVALVLPLAVILIAALAAYRFEWKSWSGIVGRYRLVKPSQATVAWSLALGAFMFTDDALAVLLSLLLVIVGLRFERASLKRGFITLAGVAGFFVGARVLPLCSEYLSKIELYAKPAFVGEFLDRFGPTDFMGFPLDGAWWIPVYYAGFFMVLNIAAEELWWRGYVLPRQIAAHGPWAWVVHGFLWAAFHIFWAWTAWDLVAKLPTALALSFVCQRQRSTWPGVIGHALGNSAFLLQIVRGVVS